ncbi:MAG: copper resistance protein CopC [Holophagales bacterium]|nr:copper resistance protein CopC [Holophagales bacterium]MYF06280.1 copper resistance protein CopC [Holophagales bacterium]MYJ25035.1 copper resistance protein CopC [Holophagales bacterium]
MKDQHRLRVVVAFGAVALLLVLAAAAPPHLKVSNTNPEDGAKLSGPVRTLRVWFNQEPDLPLSKLELTGPNGSLSVEGLHTMGEKDLMARVSGRMPDGSYTAKWQTAGDDGHVLTGEWTFTIERGGR